MDSGAAQGEQNTAPPATRAGRFGWVRAATDRVPTRWFGGVAIAVFLAATAGFGGLATVAAEPIPELAAGDEHVSDQFAITVKRAVLIDELPEAGIDVELWERALVVVISAENRWTEALRTTGDSSLSAALRLPELGDRPPDAVARFDDTTPSPWLQPGVPAELVVVWAVPGGRYSEGDEISLDLRDARLHTGSFVMAGQSWVDPVVAARVSVPVTDVGAGVAPEDEQ